MTLVRHELRQSWKSLMIWTLSIAFFLLTVIFVFPLMRDSMMGAIEGMYASMDSGLMNAFSVDVSSITTLKGYYLMECTSILGLGGALFAALTGIAVLAREEKNGTAEFLLTHPVTRTNVAAQKLVSVVIRIVVMNLAVLLLSVVSIAAIGEPVPWKELLLMHLACLILQLEIGCVCFGLSAFMSRGSLGVGLGLAIGLYFLNILANLTDSLSFLKYVTPFSYIEGSEIIKAGGLQPVYIAIGLAFAAAGAVLGLMKYSRKDIR